MAYSEFNIGEIFKKAWGYEAPPKFDIPQKVPRVETSELGQPYFATDYLERDHFLPVKLDGVIVPFAVMSIAAKKTIVSTPMPERGGSVHEIISIDDYAINIKGVFITEDGSFPDKELMQMHDIFQKNKSIELRSVISDIF